MNPKGNFEPDLAAFVEDIGDVAVKDLMAYVIDQVPVAHRSAIDHVRFCKGPMLVNMGMNIEQIHWKITWIDESATPRGSLLNENRAPSDGSITVWRGEIVS